MQCAFKRPKLNNLFLSVSLTLRSNFRSSHRRCSRKKRVLKVFLQNLQESTRAGVLFKKETPTQMFSCEFCKIFKNIAFQNTSGRVLLYFIISISKYYNRMSNNNHTQYRYNFISFPSGNFKFSSNIATTSKICVQKY